jgi:hypothetical protein
MVAFKNLQALLKSSSSAPINNCHNVRIIAASQFNQHEQETPDVRVLFTPY